MSTSGITPSNTSKPLPVRLLAARLIQVDVMFLVLGASLFLSAGRLDWWEAWAFLSLFFLFLCVGAIWALRNNPDLVNERGKLAENTKSWDKILVTLYTLLLLGTLVTAGLDARFRWSSVLLTLEISGGIGFILAMVLVGWASMTNPFLSAVVRIQDDRGHQVVTAGSYRYVRHPMYTRMLFFFWSIPPLLGSWLALIPSVLNVVVFIVRTALEDKTLQAELPGYAE